MPTISLDTFFACSLMITVIVAAMAATAKISQINIANYGNLNEKSDYFAEIAKKIVLNTGCPQNWGANPNLTLESLGLAESNSNPYALDIDKVSRLNQQNAYSIPYSALWKALGTNYAFKIRIRQLFSINVTKTGQIQHENQTTYWFSVNVKKAGVPVTAAICCYAIGSNYMDSTYAFAQNGEAELNFTIPNSSNGTILLITFARASYNPKALSYNVYSFYHLTDEIAANETYVRLSPLNYTLYVEPFYQNVTLTDCFLFAYGYNNSLNKIQENTYGIPRLLNSGTMVLVVRGFKDSTFFMEWTAYPQVPLEVGANLEQSENHVFDYIVSIEGFFYGLQVLFGD